MSNINNVPGVVLIVIANNGLWRRLLRGFAGAGLGPKSHPKLLIVCSLGGLHKLIGFLDGDPRNGCLGPASFGVVVVSMVAGITRGGTP